MKIDLSFVSPDKDAAARAPGNADADRGAMGDAFGKAVRDAGDKRSSEAKSNKPAAGAKAGAARSDEEGRITEGEAEAEAELVIDVDAEASAETAPLQSLLGALAALTAPKAAQKGPAEEKAGDEKGQGTTPADGLPSDATAKSEAADPSTAKDKRSMKLDVLRMETHFEPHQDGMVLVEGTVADAQATRPADAQAKPSAKDADGLAASLVGVAKGRPADEKTASGGAPAAAADDEALPPMRFDEALARLGRGGGDRVGGDTGRGASGAQSALAELSARQNAVKGADAGTAAIGGEILAPPSSPYNLAGQVAGPIVEALGDPGQSSAGTSSASQDAHLRMRAGGGALKTLTIQLQPEHLGTVDVSLRLNEGRLTLELAASRSDTASMLLDDQASLRKLLEHAGFSLDDAAISVITRDSGQFRAADSGAAGSQQRDTGGNASGEGRPETRGQSGGSDEQPGRRRAPSRTPEDAPPAQRHSASTYL